MQYAYQVHHSLAPIYPPNIVPLDVTRIDAAWSLTRDHNAGVFQQRKARKILVLGCGSLGSPVIELLARAGIGEIDVVDCQAFEPENCSRHVLGIRSLGKSKATAMASRLIEEIPGVIVNGKPQHASDWVLNHCMPSQYDLVVDCTAESSVRCLLGQVRNTTFAECLIAHAWLEPFCAAAHVVLLTNENVWPADDPADTINVAEWPPNLGIKLPACGVGFHPYGVADVWQAAGFAAERLLQVIDEEVTSSTAWSWIRSKTYFESLGYPLRLKPIVPSLPSATDALSITRQLHDVLSSNSQ